MRSEHLPYKLALAFPMKSCFHTSAHAKVGWVDLDEINKHGTHRHRLAYYLVGARILYNN